VKKISCRLLISPAERDVLRDVIGDKPETTIWTHVLRRGNCNAYVAGDIPQYQAAIVQALNVTAEPAGFGVDTGSIWDLLECVKGWSCILVDRECSASLGQVIHEHTGSLIRYLADINYQLPGSPPAFSNPAVRRLTVSDLGLLESAPPELRGSFWENTRTLLTEGIVAGAIIDNRIVATALVSSFSDRYADIGITTLPDFRRRGFAIAAASIVAGAVQEIDKTPVWSTGVSNIASCRIAEKLGFVEVLRRAYIMLESSPSFVNGKDTPP
jgi:hypothetical protein